MRGIALRFGMSAVAGVLALLAVMALGLARPGEADAHPLGNFTVNRYSRLELYSVVIRVRYVLDMAEIPTFQEMGVIDGDGDGQVSEAEEAAYLAAKGEELRRNLRLSLDGEAVQLAIVAWELSFPPGQGGLSTLRLALLLEAPAGGDHPEVEYRDDNYSDRLGWKEIVVRPAEGVTLLRSTVSAEDVTDELTAYPGDLLSHPLDVRGASFAYVPGGAAPAGAPAAAPAAAPAPERAGGAFASLITVDDLSLPVLVVSLLAALGFGALHALAPGHGKTFVAAYFVGVRGTAREALLLGLIIAATHTLGVLAISLVVLYGSSFILPERLYPWLGLASGIMVVALGLRLLAARLLAWRRRHEHGHAHSHPARATDGSPLPWKSLLALGFADGLTPSPSALVVLLAAVSLHRVGLGLLLIVAFSVGLAAVLVLVSLALVYGRRLLDRLGERGARLREHPYVGWLVGGVGPEGRLLRLLPVGGALALVAVGLVLAARALSQPGLLGV